jgi:hypothetical protein
VSGSGTSGTSGNVRTTQFVVHREPVP